MIKNTIQRKGKPIFISYNFKRTSTIEKQYN